MFAADPQLKCSEDIELFATYYDCHKFMYFMISLCKDFESTQASLLHHMPLPSLDHAVTAIPKITFGSSIGHSPSQSSKNFFCKYGKNLDLPIMECHKLQHKNQFRLSYSKLP